MKETNLSLAQAVKLKPIDEIAKRLDVPLGSLEHFGFYKAKLPLHLINPKKVKKNKLILVTAMSPTPKGEGKTTVSVGLNEGLNAINKRSIVVLREPSLGPIFGIKGGATGGGRSQVLPMEDINLHFTGDFSAIEKANNLLSALIDNNIQNGQKDPHLKPRINPSTVVWKRVMDSNDRFLRNIITGLGGSTGGVPTETGFNITAASEIMAILCLSEDLMSLKKRIGQIYVGDDFDGEPVFAKDLKAEGAMTLLLKEAIKPNLVQTTEGNPAIIHGGPFANIAQGTNSLIATKMGMSLCDYTVTEAGFGADLGAEKFLNIKCQYGGLQPHAVVLVATVKAVLYHGEGQPDPLQQGFANLKKHIENIKSFGLPCVVAINKFQEDSPEDLHQLKKLCEAEGVKAIECDVWWQGSKGALELADYVSFLCEQKSEFHPTYDWSLPIEEKILQLSQKIYGATKVQYTPEAKKMITKLGQLKLDRLPICMAKTPLSLSDNHNLRGAPKDFQLTIRDFEVSAGAGFIVPLAGNILRMPGLPKIPAAIHMDIDEQGVITGLN